MNGFRKTFVAENMKCSFYLHHIDIWMSEFLFKGSELKRGILLVCPTAERQQKECSNHCNNYLYLLKYILRSFYSKALHTWPSDKNPQIVHCILLRCSKSAPQKIRWNRHKKDLSFIVPFNLGLYFLLCCFSHF